VTGANLFRNQMNEIPDASRRFARDQRSFRKNARPRLVRSAIPHSNSLLMGDIAYGMNRPETVARWLLSDLCRKADEDKRARDVVISEWPFSGAEPTAERPLDRTANVASWPMD
jgi:hypothetical protein